MKIAFLNLCHTDPELVARCAKRLTKDADFDMYVHVDAKQNIAPFKKYLNSIDRVYFTPNRYPVYWGGYNAINACFELLRTALNSNVKYDYFVMMQNLDYPIKSNQYIKEFFIANNGREFIRGCPIAQTRDFEFSRKYKLYYKKDNPYGKCSHKNPHKLLLMAYTALMSITTFFSNGVIKEEDGDYPIYYGCAQWAVSRDCAKYLDTFEKTHKRFNEKMRIMQFPDEEYFHTVVHNSKFKDKCILHNEPMKRWLVNWRNLTYFEFPKEVTVMTEQDYDKIRIQKDLFVRKVRTGKSDKLLDLLDKECINK
ncbi:beta-1,6-N-acetylglucosaminyltransferase [Butyrivibrio sp. NC3005]|uniref:beta-1,6-N-acetylglucosaminyltransferase n=1 Tax=Butyrivibrio sp. NC3005 TaxID=1280685 RepID=UPI0004041B5F|nr:beta-1,6-N-acetylglucosaminyltransferase [Butyrivibrio sp. NC3005]